MGHSSICIVVSLKERQSKGLIQHGLSQRPHKFDVGIDFCLNSVTEKQAMIRFIAIMPARLPCSARKWNFHPSNRHLAGVFITQSAIKNIAF